VVFGHKGKQEGGRGPTAKQTNVKCLVNGGRKIHGRKAKKKAVVPGGEKSDEKGQKKRRGGGHSRGNSRIGAERKKHKKAMGRVI